MNVSERFWSKVIKCGPDECWGFTGTPLSPRPHFRGEGKTMVASRMMLMEQGIEIPPGMNVCHTCDNGRCVNPAHLWIGTQLDNIRDMYAKGRAKSGMSQRTHCPSGHEYTEANTRVYKNKRVCRQCDRDRNKGNESRAIAGRVRCIRNRQQ